MLRYVQPPSPCRFGPSRNDSMMILKKAQTRVRDRECHRMRCEQCIVAEGTKREKRDVDDDLSIDRYRSRCSRVIVVVFVGPAGTSKS